MPMVNKLIDKLSAYIKLKGEELKLEIIAHISRLLAHLIAFLLIGVVGVFFITFASLTLGAYLNEVLESSYSGFLIIAGFYLLMLIIVFLLLKTNRFQYWLEAIFIKISQNPDKDE